MELWRSGHADVAAGRLSVRHVLELDYRTREWQRGHSEARAARDGVPPDREDVMSSVRGRGTCEVWPVLWHVLDAAADHMCEHTGPELPICFGCSQTVWSMAGLARGSYAARLRHPHPETVDVRLAARAVRGVLWRLPAHVQVLAERAVADAEAWAAAPGDGTDAALRRSVAEVAHGGYADGVAGDVQRAAAMLRDGPASAAKWAVGVAHAPETAAARLFREFQELTGAKGREFSQAEIAGWAAILRV